MSKKTEQTKYIPPTLEETIIKDFLDYTAKEFGGVLVDITRPDLNGRTNYRFLNHGDVLKGYLESSLESNKGLTEGYAYD